ncbi:MAG: Mrp/NBP35 family ATP-binding protein [Clostridia bacterium]|nr:Mrp/NBP35 family ATP-binding protein [Clostridia bacterium]
MGCTHNCSSCSSNCSSKSKESFIEEANKLSSIKKVIGVVSGKGGVGKSLVTSLLACEMQKRGFHSAVLDADITGPSIPKGFGITEKAMASEDGILPARTDLGIDIMSINLMLQNETDPVVWRGPVIAGAVKQFWTDVIWDNVDFMFVDMPPGTGDVPLTVFQSLPVDGIVIVASPQELVSMIVEKAVKMAEAMNVPILGIVENMAYFVCDSCNKKHYIFGDTKAEDIAKKFNISAWAEMPINPSVAKLVDAGKVEEADSSVLKNVADKLASL